MSYKSDDMLELNGNGLEIIGKKITSDHEHFLIQLEREKAKLLEQKNFEKRQSYQQLCRFNPWGKPGGGAPNNVRRRQKFLETEVLVPEMEISEPMEFSFGRPGHGAPQVTKSGRLRSQIPGDPLIRFQESQNVHKSVENGIRYHRGRKHQSEYKNELDDLVRQKMNSKKTEQELERQLEEQHEVNYPFGQNREDSMLTTNIQTELAPSSLEWNYDPWGKGYGTPRRDDKGYVLPRLSPISTSQEVIDWDKYGSSINLGKYNGGYGSPHVINPANPNSSKSVVTKLPCTLNVDGAKDLTLAVPNGNEINQYEHQMSPLSNRKEKMTLMEKLGWDSSETKVTNSAKKTYLQELSKSLEEIAMEEKATLQRKEKLDGIEFAQTMNDKKWGYPNSKNKPNHSLCSTDVTNLSSLSCPIIYWSNAEYRDMLEKQQESRASNLKKMKEIDVLDSEKHFETWETFWGRPGHGAPKDPNFHRKEGVGSLFKVHPKIPLSMPLLVTSNQFTAIPIKYQRRHQPNKHNFIKRNFNFKLH